MVSDASRLVLIFTFSVTSEGVKVVLRDSSTLSPDLNKCRENVSVIAITNLSLTLFQDNIMLDSFIEVLYCTL